MDGGVVLVVLVVVLRMRALTTRDLSLSPLSCDDFVVCGVAGAIGPATL